MTGTGPKLYEHARRRIPGGTQLLSKRPEMFLPEQWPSYYSRAKGCEVWDLDGRGYVDMSYNAIGACILGFADPDVDAAAKRAIDAGTAATLNCPEEVELADLLCELHPWAGMVRYARTGGEAMAVAVRIARASTGRDKIAFCGYHGWHDWYLAANLGETDALDGHLLPGLDPAGVPRALRGTALPFRYNRADELEAIVTEHGRELGAIVMEPLRGQRPEPGFLERVRKLADETGAVLVFDEITSGFRLATGGAHLKLGVEPEIAVFAKALGNGYPIAAIIGRDEVMRAAQATFISSTNWTERIGSTAALATIRKHRALRLGDRLVQTGQQVKQSWDRAAKAAGLNGHTSGMDPLAHLSLELEDAQAAMTLYTQGMLGRGFLAGKAFYATAAHTEVHVQAFEAAAGGALMEVAAAAREGRMAQALRGPVAHQGFRRLA